MICNNCGIKGHISKNCNKPIKSYGVILIHNIEENPKILLVNRKDSICYIEILMGKYNINNHEQLIKLFERITLVEYNKLNTRPFKELWKELWILNKIININEFKKYLNYFIKLKQIIHRYKKYHKYEYTEWEIPKGRKNPNETYFEASNRELQEETNINQEDYEIIINYKPIIENFIGENDVVYENMYYIGICNNIENIRINTSNKNQIIEIKDVGLYTEEESISRIRDYNINRKQVISDIFKFIKNYKNDLILK